MRNPLDRLPLEAVRVFEVAGRHESFATAARELAVTPGAVAHRVRTLEQFLGVALFERRPHGVALSRSGQTMLVDVQRALAALDNAAGRIRAGVTGGILRLVVVEAFAEMWLMPRFAAFLEAHPDIVVEFETSLGDYHEVDPDRSDFDIWIAFVTAVPRTVQSEVLDDETLVPVCSPELIASRGRPRHPAELHEWPLLYDRAWDDYWAHWFAARDASAPDLSRASSYRLYSMMIQAAVDGMGVALGHSLLIAPHLENGTLEALLGPPLPAPARYFLAFGPGAVERPEVRAFRDWLRNETGRDGTAGAAADPPARTAGSDG